MSGLEDRTPLKEAQARLRRIKRRAARRREQVARLRAQVEILQEEVLSPLQRTVRDSPDPEAAIGEPSYSLAARLHRRAHTRAINGRENFREPILQLYAKLPAQRWAAAHGVRVPRILGRWPDPGAVDWDALPDRFVLKGNIGGGGANVYPLVRTPGTDTYTDMLTGEPTTREEVTTRLWEKHERRSFYFAEEFLAGRSGDPGAVPDDVKVFCFYGEPLYLEVRRGDASRASNITQKVRAFAIDGTELVNVRALMDTGERDVTMPSDFEALADACRKLSASIRRPMERLDFFDTDQGLVFGEMTQNSGRPPALVPDWDRRMGEVYENAYARLLADLAAEGALHVTFGDDDGSAREDDGST
jgi:hypothetical protein